MSRAFVKEPDGDAVADDAPELPQSPHPNYVTTLGLAQIEARFAALEEARRRLRAGGEDLANKLPLAHIERELRWVAGRIECAIRVDPAAQPKDRVCFGARVAVEDEDGVARSFAIVGEDEADAAAGKVSWVSPLARALLGSSVGDIVTWRRPTGDVELEIVAIDYPAG